MTSTFILACIALLLAGCAQPTITINDQRVTVELADTPEEHARGLMHRTTLCEQCGMLFIFDDEEQYTFWMKNTTIPLDMIFINREGAIVDVIEADPCTHDPCRTYTPQHPAQYVLEVNNGFSARRNIAIGDRVNLQMIQR